MSTWRAPWLLLGAACVACGGAGASGPEESLPADVFEDVGRVPDGPPASTAAPAPTTTTSVTSTVAATRPPADTTTLPSPPHRVIPGDVAESVDGSKVLIIGDSLMASTAPANGGAMCSVLGGLGWTVELDAEGSRFADFGLTVLEARLEAEDWDAAVVMLGNNYRDDVAQFAEQMAAIVDLLAPRPTLLFTVTEFEDSRREVNDVIRYIATGRSNVIVVDWALETSAPDSPYLSGDGLHLSDAGRQHLAAVVGQTLGEAPAQPPGVCLEAPFDGD